MPKIPSKKPFPGANAVKGSSRAAEMTGNDTRESEIGQEGLCEEKRQPEVKSSPDESCSTSDKVLLLVKKSFAPGLTQSQLEMLFHKAKAVQIESHSLTLVATVEMPDRQSARIAYDYLKEFQVDGQQFYVEFERGQLANETTAMEEDGGWYTSLGELPMSTTKNGGKRIIDLSSPSPAKKDNFTEITKPKFRVASIQDRVIKKDEETTATMVEEANEEDGGWYTSLGALPVPTTTKSKTKKWIAKQPEKGKFAKVTHSRPVRQARVAPLNGRAHKMRESKEQHKREVNVPQPSNSQSTDTIQVMDVPVGTSEEELRVLFSIHANPVCLAMLDKVSKGMLFCCYVAYANEEDAEKTFETLYGSTHIRGRLLKLNWATKKVAKKVMKCIIVPEPTPDQSRVAMLVRFSPKKVSEHELRRIFSAYGELKQMKVTEEKLWNNQFRCRVQYVNEADAKQVFNSSFRSIRFRQLTVIGWANKSDDERATTESGGEDLCAEESPYQAVSVPIDKSQQHVKRKRWVEELRSRQSTRRATFRW